ncbi:hypothetical protein MTBBW1_2360034 [Desulfamplus magnetovallimortis]|uniref:Sigma-54 factor interaction domain-containing protein n=1 Tax=Desulfamplus magnetovallimortis TaxID=1246637 RepID=A0A1W1HDS5_9BACT|nr:sigma-54 dependent transcriptional regulator [Desulfamplus magnetovallimortis]SLM30651.1 hypothetical protein MTBBW1_2360034 [Desulfamplus magnetovallimortis]
MTSPIIGQSRQIVEIRDLIKNVADTCLNILITGETGVGKGVVASSLHEASPRKSRPLVTVNCAALPETLLESELYGYSKGAFTGAMKTRRGKFQMADKGVLFLDEIGDMPISLQSKILHVLQTGLFSPLGSDQEIRSDVWLIAATNQDLEAKIEKREFRADLFYRLNIIKIEIPPLRERRDDIPLLVDHYISQYLSQYPAREIELPDSKVLDKLMQFPWPGNIRQLQNIIKKQLVVNDWNAVIEELAHDAASHESHSGASKDNTNVVGADRRNSSGASFDDKSPSTERDGTGAGRERRQGRRKSDESVRKTREGSKRSDAEERRDWKERRDAEELSDCTLPQKATKGKVYHGRRAGDVKPRRRKGDIPGDSILNEFLVDGDSLDSLNREFSLGNIKKKVISRVESEVIQYVLDKTAWNRSKASKILKVSYKTLLTKITELNLEPPD